MKDFWPSLAFFFLGCLISADRWRCCLGYRATRLQAFCTMGVANAGNLLIPGRIGEPLRIFLLARVGVAPEYGTSAVVQERLADQCLRVVFIGTTIFLAGVGGAGHLGSRLLAVTLVTLVLAAFLTVLVRSRESVAARLGGWIGRLPRLKPEVASAFLLRTLSDLAESWNHPGGKKALFLAFLAWLVFSVHTEYILDSYFATSTLAFAFLIMAFSPATAPTQPGFFHGLALAAMMMLGADKIPALQAAIVLHMMQMVLFTLWGILGWLLLAQRHNAESIAPAGEAECTSTEIPQ